jgi:transposase-like protein
MKQELIISSLPQAFDVVKQMGLSDDRESDYRVGGTRALKEILEGQMRDRINRHLEEITRLGESHRRNGSFSRHLLTELGDIELSIPRQCLGGCSGLCEAGSSVPNA